MVHADSPSISFVNALWPLVWGDLLKAVLTFALALGGAVMVRRRLGV